ncbi:hypothetical protein PORCRE_1413 [Porphyromonas crevioricanis JCM 15906]|uniref:Uncharacterized protein n=1 Tax=Porphyromonas crevioricanis JCM 15906 TaxID=1305617 RepID=T1CI22_9PORP|nr:hypothetical protein PORCRE_1413 [Porphyromonas crevioricanis JCM 15906]GAD06594.1 hypothetical protein PORCAN_192 [Porphyromonas crevioricanis JCM 13913]
MLYTYNASLIIGLFENVPSDAMQVSYYPMVPYWFSAEYLYLCAAQDERALVLNCEEVWVSG